MTKDARTRRAADGRWHAAVRDSRVVLLTVTSGAVNAVSFLVLGKVFVSVITGNLVLLGVAATTGNSAAAIHAGLAMAGYAAGVLVAAPIAARPGGGSAATWPASVTATLAAELVVLAGFCAGWEAAQGHPRGGTQVTLVIVLAAAMGMQASAVRRLGQMSSTYLTSTLTAVLASLATRTTPDGLGRSLGALTAVVAGAVAGGFLATTSAYAWLPVVILVPPGLVVAGAKLVPGMRDPRPDRS
jgi:uncharacterized membrane protein YoaK (UPF0700 family)